MGDATKPLIFTLLKDDQRLSLINSHALESEGYRKGYAFEKVWKIIQKPLDKILLFSIYYI